MLLPDEIPAQPGAYALLLRLEEPRRVAVGRLGEFLFEPGEYIYLGSACGPGGLRGRLRRQLGPPPANFHWHIDYLRRAAKVSAVCWTECATHLVRTPFARPKFAGASHIPPLECLWSQALADLAGAYIPVPRFGAGDCRANCMAHLVAFPLSTTKFFMLDCILSIRVIHSDCKGTSVPNETTNISDSISITLVI